MYVVPTEPLSNGPSCSVVPSGAVISKVNPRHRSPPLPPAVGGMQFSHMTSKVYSLTATVLGDATTYAYVGMLHGGSWAFAVGIATTITERDNSKISATLNSVLFFSFDVFFLSYLFFHKTLCRYECNCYIRF